MSEGTTVEITDPLHAHRIGQMYGQAEIIQALKEVPDALKLPGFVLAQAIAERIFAEMRADTVAANMRLVAKAGHDLAANRSMVLHGLKLVLTPADLVDLAEAP